MAALFARRAEAVEGNVNWRWSRAAPPSARSWCGAAAVPALVVAVVLIALVLVDETVSRVAQRAAR